eukprot:CAMPEP_0197691632 /NCGR_PEP_ID=MMETSP1338-20131121/109986_1 /TAXON_ID=43686 ORGANISM="Pelagodinium beii, Strain RCC1491" /NCGR_SAMPLE_ID=MMETSP1338 /ASSEMBLY_ACC=CAM_ASM_000754 /LENGTH=101 /DNA_ID=CAMNT_0043274205 /DNA_START=81 /DNA_END=386 /DNA_ORIENTATION=-
MRVDPGVTVTVPLTTPPTPPGFMSPAFSVPPAAPYTSTSRDVTPSGTTNVWSRPDFGLSSPLDSKILVSGGDTDLEQSAPAARQCFPLRRHWRKKPGPSSV